MPPGRPLGTIRADDDDRELGFLMPTPPAHRASRRAPAATPQSRARGHTVTRSLALQSEGSLKTGVAAAFVLLSDGDIDAAYRLPRCLKPARRRRLPHVSCWYVWITVSLPCLHVTRASISVGMDLRTSWQLKPSTEL
jgi:hypothetical protein